MINKIERNEIIDMIKGIGIVLMVSGHAKAPYTHFIYLFHMAIFFIASGFCYNTQNSKSVVSTGKYCLKKIKSIWFPYFVWMLIFSVLHNFFININVYTSSADVFNYLSGSYARVTEYWTLSQILKNIVKAFFFGGDITGLAGAFWFLAVLFEIVVAYNIVQFVLGQLFNRENQGKYIILSQTVVSVLFLIIGFICYLNEISMWGGCEKALSYYCIYHAGFLLNHFKVYTKKYGYKKHIAGLLISFICLLVLNNFGSINLDQNDYVNPIFLITVSLLGWELLYEISYMVLKIPAVCRILKCLGRNTLPILILHFMAFKIVNFIAVLIKHDEMIMVSAHPVTYIGGFWWIIYTIVGLIVPVSLYWLWKKFRFVFMQKVVRIKNQRNSS